MDKSNVSRVSAFLLALFDAPDRYQRLAPCILRRKPACPIGFDEPLDMKLQFLDPVRDRERCYEIVNAVASTRGRTIAGLPWFMPPRS